MVHAGKKPKKGYRRGEGEKNLIILMIMRAIKVRTKNKSCVTEQRQGIRACQKKGMERVLRTRKKGENELSRKETEDSAGNRRGGGVYVFKKIKHVKNWASARLGPGVFSKLGGCREGNQKSSNPLAEGRTKERVRPACRRGGGIKWKRGP